MIVPPSTCRSTVRLFKIEQTLSFRLITVTAESYREGAPLGQFRQACTAPMKFGFDIFRHLNDGSPMWIASLQTRAQAEREVAALHRSAPARYCVRDGETGAVIQNFGPGTLGKIGPAG